jgi:ring-1,2-phenylacetyl-CoA epoxidase subunit PaaE
MSIHFHPVTVKEIKKETRDCVTVEFEIPDSLKTDFQYKQGQSLTVRKILNNEEVRRTYSLCSSPLENRWVVAIKKVEGGVFSSFANDQLKKGDIVEVMEPVGKFYTQLAPTQKKNYLAFAAGSGITPVISIIKTTLAAEPQSTFTLVYGNRNRNSIIFLEELEGLKNKYISRFNLIHILSRERSDAEINSGRMDKAKIASLNTALDFKSFDEFFICGPEEMIFCIKDELEKMGIDRPAIHFELFSTAADRKQVATAKGSLPSAPEGSKSNITLKVDGRSFEFSIPFQAEISILDAALQQGADLPYACKGGMCCTCKARLLEGEVVMDVHWGLEEEEIRNGFILTCQAHPKSEKVIIDFDIK